MIRLNIIEFFKVALINFIPMLLISTFISKIASLKEISIKSDAEKMKDYEISKITIALYYCKLSHNHLFLINKYQRNYDVIMPKYVT